MCGFGMVMLSERRFSKTTYRFDLFPSFNFFHISLQYMAGLKTVNISQYLSQSLIWTDVLMWNLECFRIVVV